MIRLLFTFLVCSLFVNVNAQIQVGSNFQIMTDKSIDTRLTVADITSRNAINPMYRYVGLSVFVEADSTFYTLMSGKTNNDWRAEGITPTNTVTIDQSNCNNPPKTDYQLCIQSKGSVYMVYISFKGVWIKIK